jgi:hypothetical protein
MAFNVSVEAVQELVKVPNGFATTPMDPVKICAFAAPANAPTNPASTSPVTKVFIYMVVFPFFPLSKAAFMRLFACTRAV